MTIHELSKPKQTVVNDAQKAGFTIVYRDGCVDIFRRSKHQKPRLLQGVRIFSDGMAYDMTVDLSIAKTIRSADAIRNVLGI